MPYWTGVTEGDVCKGDVALLLAVSDEPVSIVVCTSGPDEPVPGVTPYETGSEECVVYESAVALRRTGSNKPATRVVRTSGPDEPVADEHTYNDVSTSASDEPVTGLIPYWPGSEDSVVW